jgi:hypothetical protein
MPRKAPIAPPIKARRSSVLSGVLHRFFLDLRLSLAYVIKVIRVKVAVYPQKSKGSPRKKSAIEVKAVINVSIS